MSRIVNKPKPTRVGRQPTADYEGILKRALELTPEDVAAGKSVQLTDADLKDKDGNPRDVKNFNIALKNFGRKHNIQVQVEMIDSKIYLQPGDPSPRAYARKDAEAETTEVTE